MFNWISRLFGRRGGLNADYILKFPAGKRYYQDFHGIRRGHLDPDAVKVIGRLQQFGYKAYLVGGGVRDLLLGRIPKDFDVVTNARPNEIRKVFANSRLIGRRFRIVHVVFRGNKVIEVSTARSLPKSRSEAVDDEDLYLTKDNQYGNFKDDAARRDFTINSLMFDVRNETIIDYSGGYDDLKNRIIRVIGSESYSLPEDPVRMLRAIKFAGLLEFELHPALIRGIKKYKKLIRKASIARLHEEFNKILRTGQSAKVFESFIMHGLFEAMFPAISESLNRITPGWLLKPDDTLLMKRMRMGDRMISEHEDINTTLYFGLLICDLMDEKLEANEDGIQRQEIAKTILAIVGPELGLTRREFDRLILIFTAQNQFGRDVSDRKGWVKNFRNRDYFTEAFILYKINSLTRQNDTAVQKALFWEIGLRKKLPDAIRKSVYRPLPQNVPDEPMETHHHRRGSQR